MKIVYLINNLNSGGAEWNLGRLAVAMSKQHQVTVITFNHTNEVANYLESNSIKVVNLRANNYLDFFALLRLRKVIKELQPDILHTWHYYANYWGSLANLGLNFKQLASIRGISEKAPKLNFVFSKVFSCYIERFLCNSKSLKDTLISSKIDEKKIDVIYNAIKLPNQQSFRESKFDSFKILYLGRRTNKKGLDTLVKACKKWQDLPIQIDCVGNATNYENELEQMIKKYELNNINLKSNVDYKDIANLMAGYQLLILPSLAEGLANVICEAMANDLPVLASDISSNKELIIQNETGYLFQVNQVNDLAKQVIYLYNNYKDIEPIIIKAKKFIETYLAEDKIYQKYLQYYKEL